MVVVLYIAIRLEHFGFFLFGFSFAQIVWFAFLFSDDWTAFIQIT